MTPTARREGALFELSVLIVEDDQPSREALESVLADQGACVTTAESASQAMESYEYARPRIIISDIGLAGGPDGCALLRQIRASDARRGCGRTPAIAVSGGEDTEAAARAAGFDDFLSKPVDLHRLLARIRSLAPAD